MKFGAMSFSEETIDNFWLEGSSRISPFQQIDFLKRLYEEQLPISKSTFETLRSIMEIKKTNNYTLRAKSGLSIANGKKDVGWFVGYIQKKDNVYYFATKISPRSHEMPRARFTPLRQEASISALRAMQIIE